MLRMSFVLFCFHLFVFLVILARNEAVAAFHDGCWGTKFALVGILYFASFYLGNDFFLNLYLDASKIVSSLFLIYQALLMLVVAYKINEVLVGNASNDAGGCSSTILVVAFVVVTILNGFWIVR